MTSKKHIIVYNGVIVDGVTKIGWSRAIDYKGNCSFILPNHYGAAYTIWKNREDTEFKVYIDMDDGGIREDKLVFSGIITSINATHPLEIIGKGWMEKTSWIAVQEEDSKFIIDEGVIQIAPTEGDQHFKCLTLEGEDPEIDNDAYNGDYIIISDATQGSSTTSGIVAVDGATDDGINEVFVEEVNTFTATQTDDETDWELEIIGNDRNSERYTYDAWIKLNTEAESLDDNLPITGIDITVKATIRTPHNATFDGHRVWIYVALTSTSDYNVYLPFKLLHSQWSRFVNGAAEKDISFTYPMETLGDFNRFFGTNGGKHTGPYIMFHIVTPIGEAGYPYITQSNIHLDINYVSIDIKYESDTFEQTDMVITDVIDADGETEIYVGEDISTWGVAAGDKWQVVQSAEDIYTGLDNILGVELIHNAGAEIDTGIGTDYFGISAYDMFLALNRQLSFIYYDNLESGEEILHAHKFSDATASGYTYGPSNNKPSSTYDVEIESQLYSACMVYFKNGMVGPLYATGDFVNTNYNIDKTKVLIRKDILTSNKAISVGQTWINENAGKQYSFHLHWSYVPTNIPILGQTHTINDEFGNTFPDMVCRRLSMSHDGALGRWAIDGYFGQGSTPPLEGLGTDIRRIKHDITLNETQLLTGSSVSSQRHGTLGGVTSSQHHSKYTNAEALAYVNANGLALANTKVITSQDADLTFIFGRTQIDSRFADMMTISHRDMYGQDNYALGQTSSGSTYINAPTGQLIHLQINDIMKMSLSAVGLTMGIPIAMGTNKITGLGNGVNPQDAMALGQRGAYQLSELSDVDSDLSTVMKSMETVGSGGYPGSPKEGQIYYDNDEEMLLRWNNTADAWIEIGGGAGLVGGNSLYLLLAGGDLTGPLTSTETITGKHFIAEGVEGTIPGEILLQSTTEGRYATIKHNALGIVIATTHGWGKVNVTEFICKNKEDDDFVNVKANSFIESSVPLPNDPENWKELLPEFVKVRDKEEIGLNIGLIARLALQKIDELTKRIEQLETDK